MNGKQFPMNLTCFSAVQSSLQCLFSESTFPEEQLITSLKSASSKMAEHRKLLLGLNKKASWGEVKDVLEKAHG